MNQHLKAFVAGFLSTLVFHQGVLQMLRAAGLFPRAAWNMSPVPPFGVPSVLSLAFWGGLWGIALWWFARKRAANKQWLFSAVWGALLPSAVALFLVFPLKGMPVAGGFDPKLIAGALLLNGAWGIGVIAFMRLMRAR